MAKVQVATTWAPASTSRPSSSPGSPWRLVFPDDCIVDAGEVAESDAPKRLLLKWRNEFRPELKVEGYSRCVIELEPIDESVKLTITHEMDSPDSRFLEAVSGGAADPLKSQIAA